MFKSWWRILGLDSLALYYISGVNAQATANEIEPRSSMKNPHQQEILLEQPEQQDSLAPQPLG